MRQRKSGWNRGARLREVFRRDGVGGGLGLPEDFDDLPALAVEDGLNAVDAAVENFAFGGLAFGGGAGFVGAPEVGHVGPGFGADLDLMLVKDGAAALGHGVDPAVDGEEDGGGRAVGGDADGDEAGVGEKKLAEAGAVLVGGAADRGVNGRDELVERGGGGTGGDCGCDLGFGLLRTESGGEDGGGEGEEK